jgi:hypothetical protein
MPRKKRETISWRELKNEVEYQIKNKYPISLVDKFIHSFKVTSEKPNTEKKGSKK